MKKRLKINGTIIVFAILLIVIFPSIFMRHNPAGSREELFEMLGVVFILLGQVIRVSARGYKAENSSQGVELIQGGPYALVRNPMYLGIFFIGLGMVLILFKWWVISIFLLVFISRYISLAFREEKELLIMFPQDYPDYQKRVPRFLPSPRLLLERDISEYLPMKLSWLKREIGTILAVLLFTLLMESWEDIKNEGWLSYREELLAVIIALGLFTLLLIYLIQNTKNGSGHDSGKSKSN